ncbi:alpha/beta hydrolase [Yinghuangia soli]|uniref:Alpha/beta hydrolase n=1 Tax=Yinghuangia soli TaxID=2908204 RepID=A0AA41U171_9ACTN|nr:alpha/beta hydrolase [Yinghuangia soli]MCF2529245.1 alpha/beta hydrolase [Yinghuangia soli]
MTPPTAATPGSVDPSISRADRMPSATGPSGLGRLRRGPFRFALPAVAAAALMAGCTSGSDGAESAGSASSAPPASPPGPGGIPPAATPEPPKPKGQDDPALREFYTQQLAWEPCKDDPETTEKDEREFQCATLRVPLDYAAPAARSIEIAVMRHPAGKADARIGSLLTNPGGPGGSGVDWLKYAYARFDGGIHDRFDVVSFDPRGVGASTPVRCLDDAVRDRRNGDDGPDPADHAATKAHGEQLGKEFAAACQEKSGDLLQHVGTRNAARDMDVLRGVLGDAKLNYLGYSYGTYLGSLYTEEFPDRVGRLVLDGAVDPAQDPLEKSVNQQIGFEQSFTRFAKDCAARAGCPFGRDAEKAPKIASDFLDGLRTKPLRTNDSKRKLTSNLGWTGAINLLYGDEDKQWKWLREAFTYAMRDANGAALLYYADNYNGRDEKGKYDGSMDALPVIRCADMMAEAPTPERIQEMLAKLKKEAPLFSQNTVAEDFEGPGCEYWPFRTTEKPHTVKAPASNPVLVVGTTGDPATPYEASERLAAGLEHATLLTLEGEGHGAYGKGSDCIDDAVDAYLLEGALPPAGTRCT